MSDLLLARGAQMGRHSLLPKEYQQVEYIESTGTQWIDTGGIMIPGYSFETSIMPIADNTLSSNSTAMNGYNCTFGWYHGNWNAVGDRQYAVSFGSRFLVSGTLTNSKRSVTIDGIGTFTSTPVSTQYPWLIFAYATSKNGDVSPSRPKMIARFYFLRFYNNNTLVNNFLPCYKKLTQTIGLYDTITERFHSNCGSGTFLKGSDIYL